MARPTGIDPGEIYALWCSLGLALQCAGLAYEGHAEEIHDEVQGLPRLEAAARAMGVELEDARSAVLWLLGEGVGRGEGELVHLVDLLAALLTGSPAPFRQELALPLARRATRLIDENDGK